MYLHIIPEDKMQQNIFYHNLIVSKAIFNETLEKYKIYIIIVTKTKYLRKFQCKASYSELKIFKIWHTEIFNNIPNYQGDRSIRDMKLGRYYIVHFLEIMGTLLTYYV